MTITLAAFPNAARSVTGVIAKAGTVFNSIPTSARAALAAATIVAIFGLTSGQGTGATTASTPTDPNLDANGYSILDARILFGRDTVAPLPGPLHIVVEPANIISPPR